jgi:hypothetical protein
LLRARTRCERQSYENARRQKQNREPNSREHAFLRWMLTDFGTGIPSEKPHGKFLRFMKSAAQISYFTPKMGGRYAFFPQERSIFNLWPISIISMADFHREHRI